MSLPDLEITAALTTSHQDASPVPGDPDPAPQGVARPEELAIPALTMSAPEPRRARTERVSVEGSGNRERKVRRGRGQPDAEEWQKFFEEYALDWLMTGYIALEFRGINRKEYPGEFWDELEASEEDISDIAGALSDLVHGTTVSKKHGRKIINSAAALDAAHCLALWGWRVHKTAMQARRDRGMIQPRQRRQRNSREKNVTYSEAPAQEPNGHVPGDGIPFRVYSPNGG